MSLFDWASSDYLRKRFADLEASPIGSRLARGTFWSLAGALLSRGIVLISSMMVARILGKVTFGELGIIQSSIGMFGVFAGFGLGTTAIKYVAESRKENPIKAGHIIALSSLVSVVTGGIMTVMLVVFSPWLAANVLKAGHLSHPLVLSSPLLLLGAWAGAQSGALTGFEAFRGVAISNLISGISSFPLMLIGASMYGLSGAILGLLLSSLIGCIFNRYLLIIEMRKAGISATYSGCTQEWPILVNYSLPALLAGVTASPVTWVCSVMLVSTPSGYSEMGVFNAANQWFAVLLFLPSIIGNVALPAMCEKVAIKDATSILKILRVSMQATVLIVFSAVLLVSIFSSEIMSCYGESFSNSGLVLSVVAVSGALVSIQMLVSYVIAAYGRMWMGFFMNVGWGLAFIFFSHMFVNNGALGISFARLLAYVVHSVWTFGYVYLLVRRHKSQTVSEVKLVHA